jgi:hypothetical protein
MIPNAAGVKLCEESKKMSEMGFQAFSSFDGLRLSKSSKCDMPMAVVILCFFSQISHNSKQLCCSGVLNTGHQRT